MEKKIRRIIDQEIKDIIQNGLQKARELLGANRDLLDRMARLLVERETIFTEEVDMLMEGKSVDEIMAFMDENERTLKENPFNRGKKNPVIVPDQQAEVKENLETKETVSEEKVEKVEDKAEQLEQADDTDQNFSEQVKEQTEEPKENSQGEQEDKEQENKQD